jgi:hypothetical protein
MNTDEPDWIAIRVDYEARKKTITEICAEHGVGRRRLYGRVNAACWTRRMAIRPGTRRSIIGRLYRLLERQISQMETDMTDPSDKKAAILGALTRNLEKLIELDNKENGQTDNAANRRDMQSLRKKLANQLARQRRR